MNIMVPPEQVSTEEFHDLLFSEQLIVWGIRFWVDGIKKGTDVHELLVEGFNKFIASGSASALDRMMSVIAVGAIDTIDICCTKCKNISPDEHRILGVLDSWQCTGVGDEADTLFEKIPTPTGVGHAREPA